MKNHSSTWRSYPVVAGAILTCFFLLTGCTLVSDEKRGGSKIAEQGEPQAPSGKAVDLTDLTGWNIVLPGEPSPAERYAADELQRLLKQAGAPALPVVNRVQRQEKHIYVGAGQAMQNSPLGFTVKNFGPEDLRIRVANETVVIAGGRPRGTLYGVYTFLERYPGVRFLTRKHTYVPEIDRSKVIGPLDTTYRPALQFRSSFYGENGAYPAFAVRLRNNANISVGKKRGGTTRYRLINHTFGNYLPSSRYGKEHPEWYALRNGKRRWDVGGRDWGGRGTQLCMSNPEMIRMLKKRVLKKLEKHPDWKNISVSQNDNDMFCQCKKCAAIDEKEGSHMGSLLRGVNAVAKAVEKKHPDVMVGTLAYRYSREPPDKTEPRDNVQIQLCTFEVCQFHALDDPACDMNRAFRKDLRGWADISDHIYIWHYVVNFSNYMMPCPNWFHLDEDIRFFVEHNVEGIMTQGAWNGRGAAFAELRNYVISNLLWNPGKDGDDLINEFLSLHYGNAANPIRRFMEYAAEQAQGAGQHTMCYGPPSAYGIDKEYVAFARKRFQEAKQAAASNAVRKRVEKLSAVVPACALSVALEPVLADVRSYKQMLKAAEKISAEKKKRLRQPARELNRLCRKYDITAIGEGLSYKRWKKFIETALDVELAGKEEE